MRFTPTALDGAYTADVEPFEDERGLFARVFCADELAAHGMSPHVAQVNLSYNWTAGMLRGLHYQVDPPEAKFLRCVKGAVYDAIVDLRPGSPTYLEWFGVELTEDNRRAVYVPPMFAHGYQALTNGATVVYSTSSAYTPGAERGVRWDDPAIGITWPIPSPVVSEKDAAWPEVALALAP